MSLALLVLMFLGAAAGDDAPAAAPRDTLIVLAKSGHEALLLDAGSGETFARLPTGKGPHEVAVRADGRVAVVADYGTQVDGRFVSGTTLTVLDLVARAALRTIELPGHGRPHGVQFLPDGRRLAVTSEASRSLLIVDVDKGAIEQALPTGADASHMLALAPDGSRAYVANIAGGTVSVLDLASGELVQVVSTGAGCEGVDVSPDGKQVWTSNRAADTLTVLDAASLELLAQVPAPGFPIRVKLTPDGARAVVSCATAGLVRVFDVATRAERAAIALDAAPAADAGARMLGEALAASPTPVGVLIAPDSRRAWIAATNADVVFALDLDTLTIRARFPAGPEPDGLGFARVPAAAAATQPGG